jgi:bifunctional non-homologous end joining protein LigD
MCSDEWSGGVAKAPDGDAWAHELKLDGYRLHARIVAQDVRLLTRTELDWTHLAGQRV